MSSGRSNDNVIFWGVLICLSLSLAAAVLDLLAEFLV